MTAAQEVLAVARLRADLKSGRARAIREEANLTQPEVARGVGVSQSAIAQWEAGRRVPRGDAAVRYAQFLLDLDQVSREVPCDDAG
jgi:transcriptional regulator with XRE-family HTH domain